MGGENEEEDGKFDCVEEGFLFAVHKFKFNTSIHLI